LSSLLRFSPDEVTSESMVKKVLAVRETDSQEVNDECCIKTILHQS
jgi:hypothetical protein